MERATYNPHWSDCHTGVIGGSPMTARDAYEQAFSTMPRWVDWAMAVRNGAVALFGLKTEGEDVSRDMMVQLPVVYESPDRYELGLVDRHLTFTLETKMQNGAVDVTTRIWFNHWAGRLYLAVVLIPHKIIVKQAIRRLA